MAFHNAWTNMSKKQTAYDQLMKLTMTGWDINNYIANFKQLALKAGWALAAEGTIDRFRNGLNKMIIARLSIKTQSHVPWTSRRWLHTQKLLVPRKSTMQDYSTPNIATTINSDHVTSGLPMLDQPNPAPIPTC